MGDRTFRHIASMATLALLAALSAPAQAMVITSATGPNYHFSVSSTDLINVGQPTFGSISLVSGSTPFWSTINALNDGVIYGSQGTTVTYDTLTPTDGTIVDVLLNTTMHPQGYDINSIVSLTGTGQGRSGQKYDLAYQRVGGPSFITLVGDSGATVNRNTGAWGEAQVTLAGDTPGQAILSGVTALRFTFHDAPNESMYREIDVFGAATAGSSVPEPTPYLLLGAAALGHFRRRAHLSA